MSKIDSSICIYGAGVLLRHREALAQEIESVSSGAEDIEHIHRMRVASRRLRSAFPLFQSCLPPKKARAWLAQIKNITLALGAARDVDVQINALRKFQTNLDDKKLRSGTARLELRLKQKRRRLQPPLTQAMQELQDSHILDAMSERLTRLVDQQTSVYLYTPALYAHSYQAIHERLTHFLSFDEIVYQPEKKEDLHAMRISAKWLRYTLENLNAVYNNNLKEYLQIVKQVQEMLGDIHDYDVWIDYLPRFIQKERQRTLEYFDSDRPMARLVPGILHFLEDRQLLRQQRYQQFVAEWRQWQSEDVWEQLLDFIQKPTPIVDQPREAGAADADETPHQTE